MEQALIDIIQIDNPWLTNKNHTIFAVPGYIERTPTSLLLSTEWDDLCLILTGPRQSGKTTLGKYLCQQLLNDRFQSLLYLNCDHMALRQWLSSPADIQNALNQFHLKQAIIFIDEAQRLTNPGLFIKTLIDSPLPIKLIVSGSSQLEMQSKIQEFLTGRQLSITILPFSFSEMHDAQLFESSFIYGSYPGVITKPNNKTIRLQQIVDDYINKDIIEVLKVKNADTMQKLIGLMAHASGQLLNYQQLATDCKVSTKTIQHYLSILENTFVLSKITPFVGNKRQELTSNPIYYFIDNGFRNKSLNNLMPVNARTDCGLLIESICYQELLKYKTSRLLSFDIHYWRTKGGAEVDFIIKFSMERFIPIEIKYRQMTKSTVSKALRSFIEAYAPEQAIIVSKNYNATIKVSNTTVHFIAIQHLNTVFDILTQYANIPNANDFAD